MTSLIKKLQKLRLFKLNNREHGDRYNSNLENYKQHKESGQGPAVQSLSLHNIVTGGWSWLEPGSKQKKKGPHTAGRTTEIPTKILWTKVIYIVSIRIWTDTWKIDLLWFVQLVVPIGFRGQSLKYLKTGSTAGRWQLFLILCPVFTFPYTLTSGRCKRQYRARWTLGLNQYSYFYILKVQFIRRVYV